MLYWSNDMSNSDCISINELRDYLSYNETTGIFTRRISRGGRSRAGDTAGSKKSTGYINIHIDKKFYKAHRLAWLYVYGAMPLHEIDHINGVRDDNRICNLRDVKKSGNQMNQRSARSDSTSGYLGVKPSRGRFQARITVDRKQIYIGTYKTPEEAHTAYVSVKRKLHETCTI